MNSAEPGDDPPPLVLLSRKRRELSALHDMAAIVEAQNQIAENVQMRIQEINLLLDDSRHSPSRTVADPPKFNSGDEEVAYWKNRVAELSVPTPRLETVQRGNVTAVTRDLREKARCREELSRSNDTALEASASCS